ncbi:hypothetical protein JMM81_13630 [Bacillus sp. V3B]|uniref:hypothetical protein n=1 Tax=Bacillus sp. V3B TaxID=2804915 RepID=UPI00210F15EA|nr:hypothetical protein [Bacillus sp. V3B]MCQ6275979.1 hypothetical protein [Bacillus sp. V3B]
MKNHINVNGKLFQTNKRFSQLKQSQKDWIATELYKLYHNKMKERRTTKKLSPDHRDAIISSLYEQIQSREIWIPYGEVERYAFSKTTKIVKSFKKQFPELSMEIEAEHAIKIHLVL